MDEEPPLRPVASRPRDVAAGPGFWSGDDPEPLLSAAGRRDLVAVNQQLQRAKKGGGLSALTAAVDADGNTALHRWALGNGQSPVLGEGPAVEGSSYRCVESLLNARADPDATNVLGETPLLCAARCQHPDVAFGITRALLAGRADPSRCDNLLGESPLMEAACNGKVNLCRLLLEGRANVAARSARGLTASELADSSGQMDAAQLLQEEEARLRLLGRWPWKDPVKAAPGVEVPVLDEPALPPVLEEPVLPAAPAPKVLHLAVQTPSLELTESQQEELKRLEKQSVANLRNEYKRKGFATQAGMQKEVLLQSLREIMAWHNMSAEELQQVCVGKGLLRGAAAKSSRSHEELLKLLKDASWEARGIPIHRLPNPTVAFGVLDQLETLEAKPLDELKARCAKRGLPVEAKPTSQALLARLRDLAVWEQLGASALRDECVSRGIQLDSELSGAEAEGRVWEMSARLRQPGEPAPRNVKQGLLHSLVSAIWDPMLEAEGIPVKRLGSQAAAEKLFQAISRLESLQLQQLRDEYRSLGWPVEPGMQRGDLAERLRLVEYWRVLPLPELRAECSSRGVSIYNGERPDTPEEEVRRDLISRCLSELVTKSWEKLGIQVQRMGNIATAIRVVEQWEQLDYMTAQQLQEKSKRHGLLPEPGMARHDLRDRLRTLILWQEMPCEELRKECVDRKLQAVQLKMGTGEAERRRELVGLLLCDLCSGAYEAKGIPARRLGSGEAAAKLAANWEGLESMTGVTMRQEYTNLGLLPPKASADRSELLAGLKKAALWQLLPLAELRKECRDHDINLAALGHTGGVPEKRQEVVELLLLHMGAEAFAARGLPAKRMGSLAAARQVLSMWDQLELRSVADLKVLYANLGLPLQQDANRRDLVKVLREHALWTQLPVAELKKECQDLNANPKSELGFGATEEEKRQELVDRLVLSLCVQTYEAAGVPARKLCSALAAARVAIELDRHRRLSLPELTVECQRWSIPLDSGDLRTQALTRLKSVIVWSEMPQTELRRECQRLGVNISISPAAGPPSHQLARRLAAATWTPKPAPSSSSGSRYGARPGPGFGRSSQQPTQPRRDMSKVQKYFQVLQLPLSADSNDIKQAYRKLALKYHPDKNPDDPHGIAGNQFRAVAEAYEALCEFMKSSGRS